MFEGFFFGRTRLIKLSPKKTWEGFLGAFVSTVIFGICVSCCICFFIRILLKTYPINYIGFRMRD